MGGGGGGEGGVKETDGKRARLRERELTNYLLKMTFSVNYNNL